MKTLHAIKTDPTFLEWMQLRFEKQHDNWHYRGTELWFRASIANDRYEHLSGTSIDYWKNLYQKWLAMDEPRQAINSYY